MIRTQISLEESQMAQAKALAKRENVSLAELVRRGLDHVLADDAWEEKKQRALAAVGRYGTDGPGDVAENHDDVLAQTRW